MRAPAREKRNVYSYANAYVEFGMISEKYCECESHEVEASYKNIVRNTFFLENKDITVT